MAAAAGAGGEREENEELYLAVMITNTEIVHLFHIISLFNLAFLYIFFISFH
jgi:hypothetical protein